MGLLEQLLAPLAYSGRRTPIIDALDAGLALGARNAYIASEYYSDILSEENQRETIDFSNTGLDRPVLLDTETTVGRNPMVEDMRSYHPEGKNRPRQMTDGRMARIIKTLPPAPGNVRTPLGMMYFYRDQNRVEECLKRHTRREIMHALGHAGKIGLGKKHFKPSSFVRCDDLDLGHIM